MMARESEYHSNFADARQISGGWLGRPGTDGRGQRHLFDRIDWFEALHRECLGGGEVALLCDARCDPLSWLALYRDKSCELSSINNYYSFAFRPVWAGILTSEERRNSAIEMMRSAAILTHRLTLTPVPVEDGSAPLLVEALRCAGWVVRADATGANHWLDTRGRSFTEWWAQRPGALRSTVQRKAKKGLVAISIETRFSDALWDEYESVYRASWKPAEGYPDFLREWARGESEAGTLRLGIARIDGVAVAAQYWSVDCGIAYIHKLAHVAGHDALSPGTLLTHAMFAHAFDVDRVERIDFGTGDDGYKRDWMEASAPLMTIHAWHPRHPRAWPGIARMLAAERLRPVRKMVSRLAARQRDG